MDDFTSFHTNAAHQLMTEDPGLAALLERELQRQKETLAMVASVSTAPPAVLAAAGSALTNLTTEGYPGARFHGGCEVADQVEKLAIARARALFDADYANVQPHSGSSANLAVLFALLQPGDTVLAMDLDAGGHLTHGSPASITGRHFNAVHFGTGADGLIDMDEVAALARLHRPRVIICGASSYPRTIDFARFRAIADEVGAWLLADISHIAGLVVAGEHPSPIKHAHVVTTSTYKQLWGPRGGLILAGPSADEPGPDGTSTLAATLQRGVFPSTQGTPDLASVAAKAAALHAAATGEFRRWARRVRATAGQLADELQARGHTVITGGTDTHLLVLDVGAAGLSGVVVERALESCGIIVNKNRIPGDRRGVRVTSGVRLGTNTLALRGFGIDDMARCADLLCLVMAGTTNHDDRRFTLDPSVLRQVRERVQGLCRRHPLPGYLDVLLATPTEAA